MARVILGRVGFRNSLREQSLDLSACERAMAKQRVSDNADLAVRSVDLSDGPALQVIKLRVRIAGPNLLSDGASDRMVVVGAAIWVGETTRRYRAGERGDYDRLGRCRGRVPNDATDSVKRLADRRALNPQSKPATDRRMTGFVRRRGDAMWAHCHGRISRKAATFLSAKRIERLPILIGLSSPRRR